MRDNHAAIGRRVMARRKFGPLVRGVIAEIRYLLPNGRVVIEPHILGLSIWHVRDLRLALRQVETGKAAESGRAGAAMSDRLTDERLTDDEIDNLYREASPADGLPIATLDTRHVRRALAELLALRAEVATLREEIQRLTDLDF